MENFSIENGFRAEVRRWLAAHAPIHELPAADRLDDADMVARGRAWQAELARGGYAGMLTPTVLGGRGGTMSEAIMFGEEEARYRLPKGPYVGIGLAMALPVIEKHGSAEQIERFLRPTLRGELTWCQLFSEPAAGSDLAALRTRAVRDGSDGDGDWIVNGQKVWSSWAHHADWGILIARTDPTLPKHKGLTFFVVDMKTPGIDIRPIRQMSGLSDFNETFLTDVRIPDTDRIGAIGEGWACAMTTLTGERINQSGESGDEGIAGLIHYAAATPRRAGSALDSAAVRLALASAYAEEQAERHYQARLRAMVARGEEPGAAGAIVKLAYTRRYQTSAGLALELRGPAGIASATGDVATRKIQDDYIWSAALRIAGGADEVLRNQLAERMLDMPGEIRADRNVPFDQS
ncbi:acyl-CoA dehydrogenase family protein [Sphingomonas bacterium]|uniref:acyl-CoA dehydrogenase family protein n=1 Tax=Sphingomonas bacterium TaxID=1895847 RepID=UPI001576A6CA|nr:acyl-CoA dehydrogenase family protein [Sphingomonas bacterium]